MLQTYQMKAAIAASAVMAGVIMAERTALENLSFRSR